MTSLLKAMRFAAGKHSEQRRKDGLTPYINHPIEVAEHLYRVGNVTDEAILIAAILHDTIEDTDTTEQEIRDAFGEQVASLVIECTDDKSLQKAERKRLQIVHAPHKSPGAKQIKIADKTSNLRSMLESPPRDWPYSRRLEYFKWAAEVVAGLKGVNAALDEAVEAVLERGMTHLLENSDR